MNPKARKPPSAPGPDVEAARKNLRNNKNDEIEGTFCYALFEDRMFDEALLVPLIADIECVLGQDEVSPEDRRLAHWVMLARCAACFRISMRTISTRSRTSMRRFMGGGVGTTSSGFGH